MAYVLTKIPIPKDVVRQMSKTSRSEDSVTNNMVNSPKLCWNMNDSTFIKFSEKSERNWVEKKVS